LLIKKTIEARGIEGKQLGVPGETEGARVGRSGGGEIDLQVQ